jgi:hypothetical protein
VTLLTDLDIPDLATATSVDQVVDPDLLEDVVDSLPTLMRRDPTIRAIQNCSAYELTRLAKLIEVAKANMFPQTATELIPLFEAFWNIAPNPQLTTQQRRDVLIAHLRRVTTTGSGAEWEQNMSDLFGSQWTYRVYKEPTARMVNLVTNPSGASTASTAAARVAPWVPRSQNDVAFDTTNEVLSPWGSKVFKLIRDADGAGASTVYMVADIDLTPLAGRKDGGNVMVSVYARAATVPRSFSMRMEFLNASGGSLGTVPFTAANDAVGSWTRFSKSAVVPAGATRLNLRSAQWALVPEGEVHYATGIMVHPGTTLLPYFDGFSEQMEWVGTPNASLSRETSPDPQTIEIYIPFGPGSLQATVAEQLARDITPANTIINVTYSQGFIMGRSTLGDLL